MKTEIETRFLDVHKAEIITKLKRLGAVDKGEEKLHEIIFYDNNLTWLAEHTFVRLRKNNHGVTLTFKQNKEQKVDSAQEIEFEVSDMEEAKSFLQAIGLTAYRIVEKYRHTFTLDTVTIDIDTWSKIPVYVELEGGTVEDLKSVSRKLGLTWENRFDGDARFVYKKYGFDFDAMRTVTFDRFE